MKSEPAATIIDTRGLKCPLHLLKIRKELQEATPGKRAIVYATDPAAEQDLRDFCQAAGFAYLEGERKDGVLKAVVMKC